MSTSELWDYLLEREIASEDTLQIVTNINGYNKQTLLDVLYAVTGYRDIEQIEGENE